MEGLIHIYTGEGKGKTTAAVGLAVRFAGAGFSVLFAQCLKDEHSSELSILRKIEEVRLLLPGESFGFFHTLSEAEKRRMAAVYQVYWMQIREALQKGNYQMLVIDECFSACRHSLFSTREIVHFLQNKPKELEVVLTGRDPEEAFLSEAHYVSEIRNKKHPFDAGVQGRRGVEY